MNDSEQETPAGSTAFAALLGAMMLIVIAAIGVAVLILGFRWAWSLENKVFAVTLSVAIVPGSLLMIFGGAIGAFSAVSDIITRWRRHRE